MTKKKPAISLQNFTPTQLIEYDACTRCGECVKYCPTYEGRNKDQAIEPRDKILRWRKYVDKSYGWRAKLFGPAKIPDEELKKYADDLYNCTVCGMCGTVCCAGIDTVELWEANRANLVKRGFGPYGKQSLFPKLIGEGHNPYMKQQKDRLAWMTPDIRIAEKSDIAYFIGCTAGYNQQVLCVSTARILNKLNVPFMVLGEDEWCCSSALIRTGQQHLDDVPKKAALHNIEALKARGAKRVIFACAGCFRASKIDWPRAYGKPLPFESIHMSQFLAEQLDAGKIKWEKSFDKTVTYHDPCHLGRHVGVFEEPRKVLKSMPGLKLIEMERNRKEQRCCGAGGGVKARGAKRVIFACAGCFRASKIDWPRAYGKPLPFESIHMSQFLAEQLDAGKIKWEKSFDKTVTYHDPCHLGRHVGVFEEPRKVLKSMPGLKLIEMERNRKEQRCCGAGGGVKAGIPDLALAVAKDRMNDAGATGARVLISTCPFCRRNLLDGRDELKMDMSVDDLVVLTANLMGLSTDVKPPLPGAPKESISDIFRTQTIPPKTPEPKKEAPKEAPRNTK